MKRSFIGLLVVGIAFAAVATTVSANDSQDESVQKDRQQIAGVWRIVALTVNGNPAKAEDAKKLTVVNNADGAWSLRSNEEEVGKGTSVIDPTQTPKTIDFTLTDEEAEGQLYLGIYELGDNDRRLCFAPPGKQRPTEFSSTPGSQHILVAFERQAAE